MVGEDLLSILQAEMVQDVERLLSLYERVKPTHPQDPDLKQIRDRVVQAVEGDELTTDDVWGKLICAFKRAKIKPSEYLVSWNLLRRARSTHHDVLLLRGQD